VKQPTKQTIDDATGDSLLERRSREVFDERVANLDARTRSRLNRARQAALAAARGEARGRVWNSRWLLPVGSAAALALVTVSTVQFMRDSKQGTSAVAPVVVASAVDDIEILTSSDELDMLQNVDFYAWLDTQQDDLSGAHTGSEAG
jgi:Protein of unknown function (DUF3619)